MPTIPIRKGGPFGFQLAFQLGRVPCLRDPRHSPAIVLLNTQISTAEYRLDRIAQSNLDRVLTSIGWLDKSFDSGLATKRASVSSGEHRCERNRCRLSRIENVVLQACGKSPIVVLQFAKCVVWQESVAVPSERVVCYERNKRCRRRETVGLWTDERCPNIGLPTVDIERVRIETKGEAGNKNKGIPGANGRSVLKTERAESEPKIFRRLLPLSIDTVIPSSTGGVWVTLHIGNWPASLPAST